MLRNPFALFQPFTDRLDIALLTKEDNVRMDEDVARAAGAGRVASVRQMHGDIVVLVREPTSRMIQADGMITDEKNLLLSIRMADCQTFVIYAPEKSVLGVMHVGWKSLKAGMIRSFFRALDGFFGVRPDEIFIGAGPSLCMKCAEFTDPERELEGTEGLILEGRRADLRGIADAQLEAVGVTADRRERMAGCTRCDPKTYWTYRGGDREKVIEGWTNVLCARLR